VAALATPALTLPAYNHKSEGDYNKDVAAKSGGALVCMDQEFIWPRSWQDRLEFCDLYSADRKIVHVKRYSGSATLSHLFAQGAVSIRCLLSDLQFLAQLDAKLPPTHGFAGAPPDRGIVPCCVRYCGRAAEDAPSAVLQPRIVA